MAAKKNRWPVLLLPAIFILAFAVFSFRTCRHSGHARLPKPGPEKDIQHEAPALGKSPVTTYTRPLPFGLDSMLPFIHPKDEIVRHTAFTLSYNEKYEEPDWVAYHLTAAMLHGHTRRSENFRPDLDVPTGSAELDDYRKSGYDRGHLVPAADMKWSGDAMSETFLLSNITPQLHAFNAGIWNDLEDAVRLWAVRDKDLYVVTGPVLTQGMPTIGKSKVAVPASFYKVILDAGQPEVKAIGFIIPNRKAVLDIWHFAMPVDSVERVTGIDFFPLLPDSLENALEARYSANAWRNGTRYEGH